FVRGRRNQLQRDRRLQDYIVGAPHVAHAAAADSRHHPVTPREHLAGCELGVLACHFRLGRPPRLVKVKQRLDFGANGCVFSAGAREERTSIRPGLGERDEEYILRPLVQRRHCWRLRVYYLIRAYSWRASFKTEVFASAPLHVSRNRW